MLKVTKHTKKVLAVRYHIKHPLSVVSVHPTLFLACLWCFSFLNITFVPTIPLSGHQLRNPVVKSLACSHYFFFFFLIKTCDNVAVPWLLCFDLCSTLVSKNPRAAVK